MILMVLCGRPGNHPSRIGMRTKCSSLEGHLYLFGELPLVFHAQLPYCDGYVRFVFHPDCYGLTFLLWLRFIVLECFWALLCVLVKSLV